VVSTTDIFCVHNHITSISVNSHTPSTSIPIQAALKIDCFKFRNAVYTSICYLGVHVVDSNVLKTAIDASRHLDFFVPFINVLTYLLTYFLNYLDRSIKRCDCLGFIKSKLWSLVRDTGRLNDSECCTAHSSYSVIHRTQSVTLRHKSYFPRCLTATIDDETFESSTQRRRAMT